MRILCFTTVLSLAVAASGCTPAGQEGKAGGGSSPQVQAGADFQVAGSRGKVLETMSTAGYTYVNVDTGKEKVWAAAPEFAVQVGDEVVIQDGMPMHNFRSETLNRDFPVVYFANAITVGGKGGGGAAPGGAAGGTPSGRPPVMPGNHPAVDPQAAAEGMDFSGIAQADGGVRVADLYSGKAELAGKEVLFRGKVVKVNRGILGTNWLHVQDGSGTPGANDITVTTGADVAVGDVVLVKGTLGLDRDFGAGYAYAVIVEKAAVTKE